MTVESLSIYSLERFESKLNTLNKKAAKIGIDPITVENVEKTFEKRLNNLGELVEVFAHWTVEVNLPEDIIAFPGGWQLVGVIDHTENIVKSVPGYNDVILTPYVERGAVCDHCHTSRDRNETFIVVGEEGPFLQVGRSCLGDLLGISPARALGQVEIIKEALDEDEWLGEKGGREGHGLEVFLSHVAACIRTAGWRSRSSAGFGETATADQAASNIFNEEDKRKDRYGQPLWFDRTEADKQLAKDTVAWLKGLEERSGLNDYLSNLRQIGQNDYVTHKSLGYAASAINAYLKEREVEIKRAAERQGKPESGYLGVEKQRLTFKEVRLVKSYGFDTEWGYSFIHRFLDYNGNVIVWKTGTELDQDSLYDLTATVKAHEKYRDEKQTVVTRAKVVKLEEA